MQILTSLELKELLDLKERAQNTQKVLLECISIYEEEIKTASIEIFKNIEIPKAYSQYKVIEKIIFVLKALNRELSPEDICFYMSVLDKSKWRRETVAAHIGMYAGRKLSKGVIYRVKENKRVFYGIRNLL